MAKVAKFMAGGKTYHLKKAEASNVESIEELETQLCWEFKRHILKRNSNCDHLIELKGARKLEIGRMSGEVKVSDRIGKAVEQLRMVQGLIDISASNLFGLRTQCTTSSDLIQQEIRTLEGKLVKLFSRQLVTKQKAVAECGTRTEFDCFPSLVQWLQVVGINNRTIKEIEERCSTLEELLSLPDGKVSRAFDGFENGMEEGRQLLQALRHLHAYSERQKQGHKDSTSEIYWSSAPLESKKKDYACSSGQSSRSSSIYDGDEGMSLPSPGCEADTEQSCLSMSDMSDGAVFSPHPSSRPHPLTTLLPGVPLKRSKSDEANLGHKILLDSQSGSASVGRKMGKKLSPAANLRISIPSNSSDLSGQSDSESEHRSSYSSSSPRTPVRLFQMGHKINHRWSAKTFVMSICDYCHKYLLVGLKCKSCKFKSHKKCATLVPPSCGLPKDCEDFFVANLRRGTERLTQLLMERQPQPLSRQTAQSEDNGRGSLEIENEKLRSSGGLSEQERECETVKIVCTEFQYRSLPSRATVKRTNSEPESIAYKLGNNLRERHAKMNATRNRSHNDIYRNAIDHQYMPYSGPMSADAVASANSSPTLSSASSAPPSPSSNPRTANAVIASGTSTEPQHFRFPETTIQTDLVPSHTASNDNISNELVDSTATLTRTESSKSRVSQDTSLSTESTISEGDVSGVEEIDAQISDVNPTTYKWNRQRQSLMSEWEIPLKDLLLGECIGEGRFGKVHKGRWHGEVAVKMVEIENITEEQQNAFKFQVTTFRKTRHENLILFMGACMDPPKLAIITSFCRGATLYTRIHVRKDKFPLPRMAQILTQIAQGMSYLHSRKIVHTDLKSKNVFLEPNNLLETTNKVVITDFGLFNVAELINKSERPGWLKLPRGWLYYLAPELVRLLSPYQDAPDSECFTYATDVYAFGTLWFEMCSGGWPFKKVMLESVIYQVGKGLKQSLAHLDLPTEVKDTLSMCWAFQSEKRPNFGSLLKSLDRLPKKARLQRSPSQPCTVGRPPEALI